MQRGAGGRFGTRVAAAGAVGASRRPASSQRARRASAERRADESQESPAQQTTPENPAPFSATDEVQQGQHEEQKQQSPQHHRQQGAPSRNFSSSMQSPKGSRIQAQRSSNCAEPENEYDPKSEPGLKHMLCTWAYICLFPICASYLLHRNMLICMPLL